jgi:peptidoglycan/LPS O-acetylase OafA/YrhL
MPGLDGLRGALVVGILGYHLGYAPGMFITVDGFFALSGFLITLLLLDRPPGAAREFGAWWGRRMRRLAPAVTVTVLAVVVIFSATPGVARDAAATLTWWQNWNQVVGGATYWSPDPSPLRHAWTLSIEEQFYLVWPLALVTTMAIARRLGRHPARSVATVGGTVALVSFAWAAWLATSGVDLNRIYLGTDTRAGSLGLGCAAAALVHGRATRAASHAATATGVVAAAAVLALGSTLSITDGSTYTGGLAAGSVAWVTLVVVAARPGPLARVLSARPLRWLGVRSYGVYLWSWPTQLLLERTWPDAPRPLLAAVTVVASLALGAASLRFVEAPLRSGTGWATRTAVRRVSWAATSGVVVVAIIAVSLSEAPRPAHESVSQEESAGAAVAAARAALGTTTTTAPPAAEEQPPEEVPEEIGSTPSLPPPPLRVISAGDSQAAMAAHPVVRPEELPPHIAEVILAGVLGCGVLVRAPGWTLVDPVRGEVSGDYCIESAEVAEVTALESAPDWMVLFSGGFERPYPYKAPDGRVLPARHPEIRTAVAEHLTSRIMRAHRKGVRTALVEWACPGPDVGDETLAEATRWHNAILREVAASTPGTITIPPNHDVCIDGDAAGRPTPEKDRAWGYEVHPVDRAWLWDVHLGRALLEAS